MDPDTVRRALEARFRDQSTDFQCRISGPRYVTDSGEIFWGRCSIFAEPLAVKYFRNSDSRNQYESLVTVKSKLDPNDEFDVPKPYANFPNENILVMEWVDGRTLSSVLTQRYLPHLKARSYLNRAGRWLYRFHNIETLPPGRLDTEKWMASLLEELSAVHFGGGGFVKKVVRVLEETAPGADLRKVPQGLIHGDFKPDNILLSEGRTVGIDFEIRYRNVVISDLVHFINHLLLLSWEPRSLAAGIFHRRYSLVESFLEGYRAEGDEIAIKSIAWMKVHHLLRMYIKQKRRIRNKIRALYLLVSIIYEINRSIKELTIASNQIPD